jgi:hypothetical protein
MDDLGPWMRDNLATQGYRRTDAESDELALGLRFSTGMPTKPITNEGRAVQ